MRRIRKILRAITASALPWFISIMCLLYMSLSTSQEAYDATDDVIRPASRSLSSSGGKRQALNAPNTTFVRKERTAAANKASRRLLRHILPQKNRPPDDAYHLNVTHSDLVALDREIADTRPTACSNIHYDLDLLPKVSIIIPFYNEALSMLLRTIHSVLNRSPPELLQEVIVIDDKSSHESLQDPLEQYLSLLPKVTLLRNRRREGLIRSRLRGCRLSSAPIVVFLDAHTECNVGWLPPLLEELRKHPKTVVQPFIDGIDVENLLYSAPTAINHGTFSWDLRYVWTAVPEFTENAALNEGTPYWSPTLVGCAFAVNKAYFFSIGAFDDDQLIWGGENIELSFKSWMCGGTVVTLPCSRVGHIFRPLPYLHEGNWQQSWQRNLMRVADVWMDGYRKYFYSSTRIYPARRVEYTAEELVTLKKRKQIKEDLKCKSFKWFLDYVTPNIPIPPHDAFTHGEVVNYGSQACWHVLEDGYVSITYACYEHKLIPGNIFTLTKTGRLLYRDKCVMFKFPEPAYRTEKCPEEVSVENGLWRMDYPAGQGRWGTLVVSLLVNGETKDFCTTQVTSAVSRHKGTQMPQASLCEEGNDFQIWSLSYRFDYTDSFIDKLDS